MDQEIDVLCINCQDLIAPHLIKVHSEICFEPLTFLIKLEASSSLKFLHFKIDKLKCSMEAITQIQSRNLSEKDTQFFQIFSNLAQQLLLAQNDKSSLESCLGIFQQLEELQGKFNLEPSVVLYVQRLKLLTIEKCGYIRQQIDPNNQKQFTAVRNSVLSNKLIEISSHVEDQTDRSCLTSLVSPFGEVPSDISELEEIKDEQIKEETEKSAEDLQRFFYSLSIAKKFGYSAKHPSRLIQIPLLYQKALDMRIPVENWEAFMDDEFEHPERWVQSKQKNW